MIEMICDKCGKKIVLRYYEQGFGQPDGWDLETQFFPGFPGREDIVYRIFCPDCNPKMLRRVEE